MHVQNKYCINYTFKTNFAFISIPLQIITNGQRKIKGFVYIIANANYFRPFTSTHCHQTTVQGSIKVLQSSFLSHRKTKIDWKILMLLLFTIKTLAMLYCANLKYFIIAKKKEWHVSLELRIRIILILKYNK